MKSMTGYGRGEYKDDNYECVVEIKTINHRYKDFSIRMPWQLKSKEEEIKKYINKYIKRGRTEIFIKLDSLNVDKPAVKLDLDLAKSYYNALNELKNGIPDLSREINLSLIAGFPDVIEVVEKEYNKDQVWDVLLIAMNSALEQLNNTRIEEGNNLKKDLASRCDIISKRIETIEKIAPEVEREYKEKLTEKITEYANAIETDNSRILTEVAIFAEKINITEEIIRLYSHIKQFKHALNDDYVGRKLDFLIQEMNREVNTIGSKGNNYHISIEVVDIKSELEKMREQIQNIE